MFDSEVGETRAERSEQPLSDLPRAAQLEQLRARMAAIPPRSGASAPHASAPQQTGRVTEDVEVIPIEGPLGQLLPHGGLPRGSVVCCSGSATILMGLLAQASGAGRNVAMVGNPGAGWLACAELGGELERIAHVLPPPGSDVLEVVTILADGIDVIALSDPSVTAAPARSKVITARIRERGAVLLTASPTVIRPSLTITARARGYDGLGQGSGRLRRILFEVAVTERSGSRRTARIVLDATLPERVRWHQAGASPSRTQSGLERTG
ncbi:hypothetical protein OG225_41760 (plasmid) [Nocardia sp. NBC_01377]|uniref:hypothetical protein n=1 Tax=Nocardia sp. NBC_01377 TaxID=2903595 RepID=UPI002F90B5CB